MATFAVNTRETAAVYTSLPQTFTGDFGGDLTASYWVAYITLANDAISVQVTTSEGQVQVYEGNAVGTMTPGFAQYQQPIQQPVSVDTTYYFQISPIANASATVTVVITALSRLYVPDHTIVVLPFGTNESYVTPIGTATGVDPTTGIPTLSLGIDACASSADVTADGVYAFNHMVDGVTSDAIHLCNRRGTLIARLTSLAWGLGDLPPNGALALVCSDQHSTFYVGPANWYVTDAHDTLPVTAVSADGVIGQTWNILPLEAPSSVGSLNQIQVSLDGETLYWIANQEQHTPIRRFSLATNAALSHLVGARTGNFQIVQIIVAGDGSILALYENLDDSTFSIRRFSTAGALSWTISADGSTRMARSDSATTFLLRISTGGHLTRTTRWSVRALSSGAESSTSATVQVFESGQGGTSAQGQTFGPEHNTDAWFVMPPPVVADDPNVMLMFNVGRANVTPSLSDRQYPDGWAIWTGDLSTARASCLFSRTMGSAMSHDLKPYVAMTTATNTLGRADEGTDDLGTAFAASITTRAMAPWGEAMAGTLAGAVVTARAGVGVSLTVTTTKDFGGESRSDTVTLTPTGTESRVHRRVGGGVSVGQAGYVQLTIGDAEAVSNGWTIDAVHLAAKTAGALTG